MAFRPTAGAGDLRRGRVVRLQHLRQRRNRSEKGAKGGSHSAAGRGRQPAGFEAAVKLRQDEKLTEARDALATVIQKYPAGKHLDEARDNLGEVNAAILLSRHPSPEKIEYIVKPGDVLAKIAPS